MATDMVAKVLSKALALIIDRDGWTQNVNARDAHGNSCAAGHQDAVSFCARGAVRNVCYALNLDVYADTDDDDQEDVEDAALAALARAIEPDNIVTKRSDVIEVVTNANDCPTIYDGERIGGDCHARIVDAFARAIRARVPIMQAAHNAKRGA